MRILSQTFSILAYVYHYIISFVYLLEEGRYYDYTINTMNAQTITPNVV